MLRQIVAQIMLTFALSGEALALSDCCHHIICALAFRSLDSTQQTELISILKAHPFFDSYFAIPEGIQNKDEWLIGRAACWPDDLRNGTMSEFDRPQWHYQSGINKKIGDSSIIAEAPLILPPDSTLETRELQLAQVILLCLRTMRSTGADREKAIALCWLCHLVADIHNPCNTGSLYAPALFEAPFGDRNANLIFTNPNFNLNRHWSTLLGNHFDEKRQNQLIKEMLIARNNLEERPTSSLEITTWIDEGQKLANTFVYTHEILKPVEAAILSGEKRLATIKISEDYTRQAEFVMKRRAITAGKRLGLLLQTQIGLKVK